MIPKNRQLRRLSLCLCHALFVFLFAKSVSAADLQAFTEDLPPLNYLEKGEVKGFSVELLRELAKESQLKINIIVMPWSRAKQTALLTNDAVLLTLVRTPERENQFIWLGPIAKRKVYLYRLSSRNDIELTNLEAAKKFGTGVVKDSASMQFLMQNGFASGRELDLGSSDAINFRKLLARRVDLVAALDFTASVEIVKEGGQIEQIKPALLLDQTHDYYIGINPKASPDSVQKLKNALEKLRKNGKLKQMQQSYFGVSSYR